MNQENFLTYALQNNKLSIVGYRRIKRNYKMSDRHSGTKNALQSCITFEGIKHNITVKPYLPVKGQQINRENAMEMDELLKSIRLAINMEREAALYYKQAALMANDELARVMLMQFSQDEEKHRRMLEYAVEKYYLRSGRFDFPEISPPADYGKDKLSPLYSKKLAELAGEPEPVLAAVKKFAEAESKAILLYRKLADSKQEENFRKFFIALADWEERHLAALEKQALAFEGG